MRSLWKIWCRVLISSSRVSGFTSSVCSISVLQRGGGGGFSVRVRSTSASGKLLLSTCANFARSFSFYTLGPKFGDEPLKDCTIIGGEKKVNAHNSHTYLNKVRDYILHNTKQTIVYFLHINSCIYFKVHGVLKGTESFHSLTFTWTNPLWFLFYPTPPSNPSFSFPINSNNL